MFMGAVSGLASSMVAEKLFAAGSALPIALFAVLGAFLFGALGALIYGFLTVTLRANQNVTGLTLSIFGTGLANFLGETLAQGAGGYAAVGAEAKAVFASIHIPFLSDIPVLGRLLFSYNFLVYLGVAVAIALWWFLKRTRAGLNLRAVGENPATADAAGVDVTKYKYLATCIGGGICGIGGMYVSMVTCSGVWVHNGVSGLGWIAVALVIFAAWSPLRALIGSLVFGGLSVMRMYVHIGIPMEIYDMVPYVATVLVLIFTSIRQKKESMQPASCGINYFREDR
jgi:ABC-type uncharacterized transport system permease subunit